MEEASDDEHGVDSDVTESLEQLDQEWGETEEMQFAEVPPGTYEAQIDKAVLNHAKSSGRLQVSWELTILSGGNGDMRGRKVFKHDGLDSDDNRGRFRGALAKLGVEWPASAKELPNTLEELCGTYAQVKLKANKEKDGVWTNFDKALDAEELTEAPISDEDDAPEEDAAPAPRKGKKGKPAPEPEEEEEAEAEEEEAPEEEDAAEDEAEEDADEAEEPEAEEEAEEEDATEDPAVEAGFRDPQLTPDHKKRIKALMVKYKLPADQYDKLTDALCDMAEYIGMSGKFAKPDKLIAKLEATKYTKK